MHATKQVLPAYDHRRGSGPTLVFLHYWGGSARTWNLVTDRLADHDVLTMDFRGWSRSRGLSGPYTLSQLAADTLSVLDDAGARDYVLVGHSMGGKVAQLVAGTRPARLRGLILVGSGPAKAGAQITTEYREQLSHAYDSEESTAQARDDILTARALSDELKAQIVTDSRSSADAARTEWPLRGIIAGENDHVEPAQILQQNLIPYLPGAELMVIPSTGHLIPLEAPTELANAISDFSPAT